jgi:hypothetical protein
MSFVDREAKEEEFDYVAEQIKTDYFLATSSSV